MPEFDLALNTGLRLSEMYGLSWDDVDFVNRVLTVRLGKNGGRRYAPLNAASPGALEALAGASETGWVILNTRGERLTGPKDWFEPVIKASGLTNSLGIASGIPLPVDLSWLA